METARPVVTTTLSSMLSCYVLWMMGWLSLLAELSVVLPLPGAAVNRPRFLLTLTTAFATPHISFVTQPKPCYAAVASVLKRVAGSDGSRENKEGGGPPVQQFSEILRFSVQSPKQHSKV